MMSMQDLARKKFSLYQNFTNPSIGNSFIKKKGVDSNETKLWDKSVVWSVQSLCPFSEF
jgi:hypothetical protein